MTFPAIQSLNTFQRLMLEWEKFAPYNAGQFASFSRASGVGFDQLAESWALLGNSLNELAGPHSSVVRPQVSIGAHITEELNRRFSDDDAPLRPFVIEDAEHLHLGIMYRHAIADSASIRMVMRAWLSGQTHERFTSDYSGPRAGVLNLSRAVISEIARLRRLQWVRRLPRERFLCGGVTWSMHELPEGLIDQLLTLCRTHGTTINDLFVAIAARVSAEFVPFAPHAHRTDLAVGTIVDLRSQSQRSFGLTLGFMQTFLTVEQINDPVTAMLAASQTSRRATRNRLVADSQLRLRAALWEHGRLNHEELSTFYRKRCPLIAGISNVNLNRTEIGQWCMDRRATYTRVSPLGPMLPLVFTPTTVGSRITLGVTTRDGLFDADRRERLINSFIDELVECGKQEAHFKR